VTVEFDVAPREIELPEGARGGLGADPGKPGRLSSAWPSPNARRRPLGCGVKQEAIVRPPGNRDDPARDDLHLTRPVGGFFDC
jgi:hypothetical protein